MSVVNIRAALVTAINAITPALPTAWQNSAFKPTVDVPYQKVAIKLGKPENIVYGKVHREVGVAMISLMYPTNTGVNNMLLRAELIRDTLYRGASFDYNGTKVMINRTPEIQDIGRDDGDRYVVVVSARFFANVEL